VKESANLSLLIQVRKTKHMGSMCTLQHAHGDIKETVIAIYDYLHLNGEATTFNP
jgi:hypothetical protein